MSAKVCPFSHLGEEPLPTGQQLTAADPEFRECPHRHLDRLRAADPVHRDHELGRVFPTRFDDVKAVVSGRSFSSDPRKPPEGSYHCRGIIGTTPLEKFEPSMLHLDGLDHKRIRSLVTRAFNARSVEQVRPRIREIAGALLDRVHTRDSFDLISAYAQPLPIIIIAEILGVDPADREQFTEWSEARTHTFNPFRTPQQTASLEAAQRGLNEYFAREIEKRRRHRRSDLISELLSAEGSGKHLTEREIALTCNLLLVAGNVTTADLIGNSVLAFLHHPDQLAKLRARPALIENAVEEMLRYDPPVAQTSRVAVKPSTIGETGVQPGEAVTLSLLAAGRDPSRHSQPHHFDIERTDTSHVSFGGGAHYCLGASLARAETQIALATLFERFPRLSLDPRHAVTRKSVPGFNGLKALWVTA